MRVLVLPSTPPPYTVNNLELQVHSEQAHEVDGFNFILSKSAMQFHLPSKLQHLVC